MRSSALRTAVAAMTILIAGCGASPGSDPTPAEPTPSQTTPGGGGGYGTPAIGHGGLGPTIAVALVAFPQTDVIVAVQALLGSLEQVATVVGTLRDAAQP